MAKTSQRLRIEFPVWEKQALALNSRAREILYGGAAGGGKSHLDRVALISWCLGVPGLQAYFFRREYADLVRNHIEGPTGLLALLAPLIQNKSVAFVDKQFRFANGSKIYLCHCQHEKDVFGYHGSEIHALVIEEATQFTEFMIRYLRTRLRAPIQFLNAIPEPWRGLFPRALYTSNPGGAGHGYFKQAFVDNHAPFTVWQAPPEEGGMSRQYIPARLSDNPSLNAEEYAQQLMGIGSEAYVRALLNGDWNASIGSFFPKFDYDRHVIKSIGRPPPEWFRFRTFDWGSSAPFAALWWAVANGEKAEGIEPILPRGALLCYKEWYGCNNYSPAKGCGMRNEDIADGIRQRSIHPEEQRVVTLTDSLPFQDRGGKTIGETFAAHGVLLTEGDTSRIPGWSQMRARFRGASLEEEPMLYFTEQCIHCIRTIPLLQHELTEPEDCTGSEDHCADSVRLACMAREKIIILDRTKHSTDNLSNGITFNDAIERIRRAKTASGTHGW